MTSRSAHHRRRRGPDRVRASLTPCAHPDGRAFAVAVFTRAHRPFEGAAAIEAQMAAGAASAIAVLR